MISLLPKNTLHTTDIICTVTILYVQEERLIKAFKNATLTKNNDVIDLKF